MGDLERLFHLIVTNLAATEPARLHHPIAVADLPRSVVPYRTSRRVLGVVTSEEYEHLLLRLVAGEGGYAETTPAESLARFRVELAAPNPDLGVLTTEGNATILLATQQIAFVLGGRAERDFEPPEVAAELPEISLPQRFAEPGPIYEPEPEPEPELAPAPSAAEPDTEWETRPSDAEVCGYCGGSLPAGRIVHFCPHCGQHLSALRCPRCQAEVEYGWRHCIACGTALAEP